MIKVLGGLLVAALLSNPLILGNEFSYFHSQELSLIAVKKLEEESEGNVTRLIYDIDDNQRSINNLLKNKYRLVADINTQLKLKELGGAPMTREQIECYQKFNESYNFHSENINEALKAIEHDNLKLAAKELYRKDSNFSSFCRWLLGILERQAEAITNLLCLIDAAENTLAVI